MACSQNQAAEVDVHERGDIYSFIAREYPTQFRIRSQIYSQMKGESK